MQEVAVKKQNALTREVRPAPSVFRSFLPQLSRWGLLAGMAACGGSPAGTTGTDAGRERNRDGDVTRRTDGGGNGTNGHDMNGNKPPATGLFAFHGSEGGVGTIRYDIYVAEQGGENRRNLTDNRPVSEHYPAWSPDGTRLVFGADNRLQVMDYETGEITTLAEFESGRVTHPAWSSDGARIVFAYDREDNTSSIDLYIINADGSGGPMAVYQADGHIAHSPTWSPDGTRIGFVLNAWAYAYGPYGIFTMRPDGSDLRTIMELDTSRSELGGLGGLAWSPDGTELFFSESAILRSADLGVFAVAVNPPRDVRTVNETAKDGTGISFSPDGTRLAYEVPYIDKDIDFEKCCEIWSARLDGSDEAVIIPSSGPNSIDDFSAVGWPAWKPK